jgi:hypothetical protein
MKNVLLFAASALARICVHIGVAGFFISFGLLLNIGRSKTPIDHDELARRLTILVSLVLVSTFLCYWQTAIRWFFNIDLIHGHPKITIPFTRKTLYYELKEHPSAELF